MAETNTATSVKKHYDYAQQQIDEQAILDKYNAATIAQYNIQKEQNRLSENQFYNQMYNTQRTALDTIRQTNAAAVSSGASRGVQAANELSSLLGFQQESAASATELAQASRQTDQAKTAAMLENILKAYQQAAQERAQLVSQGIEAASVDVEREANQATANRANYDALQSAAKEGSAAYFAELANQGYDFATNYSVQGEQALNLALTSLTADLANTKNTTKQIQLLTQFNNSLQTDFGISLNDFFPGATGDVSATISKLATDSPTGKAIALKLLKDAYTSAGATQVYRNKFSQNTTGV